MAKLNNLYYQSTVFWGWSELQYYIEKELSFEDLVINEIERVEDDIFVTFEIEDREEEILNFLKQYCNNEAQYKEFLDYLHEGSGELIKSMVLNILTKILKDSDDRIKVLGLEASYYGVSIRFDFEEPLVKTAVSVIRRDSIFEDLKGLLNGVSGCTYDEHLQNVVNDISSDEQQLDFIVEDVLKKYMDVNFSNYSIDILDGNNFDETIVSIAVGC